MKKKQKKENKKLIKMNHYDIFTIVENYNEGVKIQIILGNYLIEEGFESVESAKTYIDSKPWKLICAIASVYAKIINNLKMEVKNEN